MTSSETPAADGAASPSSSPAREKLAPGSALILSLLIGSTFTVLLNEMLLRCPPRRRRSAPPCPASSCPG
jgi:hypothetical protein